MKITKVHRKQQQDVSFYRRNDFGSISLYLYHNFFSVFQTKTVERPKYRYIHSTDLNTYLPTYLPINQLINQSINKSIYLLITKFEEFRVLYENRFIRHRHAGRLSVQVL